MSFRFTYFSISKYLANKGVYSEYLNAKNKPAFREAHRTELTLYEAARKFLKEEYGDKKIPSLKKLKEEKQELTLKKNSQYEEYSETLARHRNLQNICHNIHEALGISHHEHTKNKDISIT